MSAAPRVVVGHGTIRFRRPPTGSAAAQSSSSASTASVGPSGPVGHGTIRLRGRLEPSEQQAPPVIAQPDAPDEATAGAREDILAALSTTP